MNRQDESRTRYYIQWDTHARHMSTALCSLMEHQSLVDLAVCCGTNTIHAHKCVLAANSPYFREQLEKNPGTEQVVLTGIDFVIVKSLIEFMYCGETTVLNQNIKYMTAAAKFFQMRAIQTLGSNNEETKFEADAINIPAPVFLPKKPKYPNAFRPLNNPIQSVPFNTFKNPTSNDPYFQRKVKRKFVRTEAEKACAKEAAASRFALEALRKELSSTSQMSSFVIEESCTETTVENFIPHSDETYINNLNHIENVPLQVVNYDELNNSIIATNEMINIEKTECPNNMLRYSVSNNSAKDKLKQILGEEISDNVEIMFRTSDGNFVGVTDDVLQNLSNGNLQYQIIDEHGQIREVRDLQMHEQNLDVSSLHDPLGQQPTVDSVPIMNVNKCSLPFIDDQNCGPKFTESSQIIPVQMEEVVCLNDDNKDSAMCHIISDDSEIQSKIVISSSSSECSLDRSYNKNTSPKHKKEQTNTFLDVTKDKENYQVNHNVSFGSCDVNQFLNATNFKSNCIDNNLNIHELQSENKSGVIEYKDDNINGGNSSNQLVTSRLYASKNFSNDEHYQETTGDIHVQENAYNDNSINNISLSFSNGNDIENLPNVDKYSPGKASFTIPSVETEVPWQMFEDTNSTEFYTSKRMRSGLKPIENIMNNEDDSDRNNKVRRLIYTRKRKHF